MNQHPAVLKTIRRLEAAEGYLELQMPAQALEELGAIADPGPFEASISLLKGEALKGQERYDDAIAALQKAAQMIPAPHNRRAWMSLGECYRLGGREDLANLVEAFTSAPQAPPKVIVPILNISITIQPPIDLAPDEELPDGDFEGDFDPDGEFDGGPDDEFNVEEN